MAYQVRNIIVGAAALFLSAGDSTVAGYTPPALPAGVAGTSMATTLDATPTAPATNPWRHAGFTSEGLELAYEPDYGDVEVDQLLDSAKIFKTSMRVSLNTTLTEASLENLLVAWGQGATTRTTTTTEETLGIAAGSLGDEPVERSLVAVGPGPRTAANARRERLYHARRVLSVEATSFALRRSEATVFPVSFRLLPDPTAAAGQEYGIIRDRTV